jgi:hypothetical protein
MCFLRAEEMVAGHLLDSPVSGLTWHLVHWVGSITYNNTSLLFTCLFRLDHVMYFVIRAEGCKSVSTFPCRVLSSAGQVCNIRQLTVLIRRENSALLKC